MLRTIRREIDRFIGSGSYKSVYTVKGDSTKVLLTTGFVDEEDSRGPGGILSEYEFLEELRSRGIPTMRVHEVGILHKTHDLFIAMLADRYVIGSSSLSESPETARAILKVLGEGTLDDIERIRKSLQERPVYIEDFQFLFSKDGRLVVSDPLDVHPFPSRDEIQENENLLFRVEALVRYAMAVRRGEAVADVDRSFSLWGQALNFCRRNKVFGRELSRDGSWQVHVPSPRPEKEYCGICWSSH